MKRFAMTFVTALTLAMPAFAGDQYVDGTGYAVSGYDVVAYRSLDQVPAGQAQPKAVRGHSNFTAEYNGATWAFSTEENRDKFLKNPAYYVPAYDGHCAYGVSRGGKVPANPNLWRIVDDKLYLNITDVVVGFFEEDIPGNINLAEGNWPGIEGDGASNSVIPKFTSEGPVAN
ncbi:YHS domain protein [Ruegeria denitrificans]|uniref:YHS domain protein n=1 Tax=Ruegeria denitrificans TaxID=1715692 RepID=A0A0P1I1Z7_9RHOB|nr:YHS domain-containing (seleno)protein [Ruegeria denitrificans]CUJ85181.1 YHS domain protein [Ruegeria denitrificans]